MSRVAPGPAARPGPGDGALPADALGMEGWAGEARLNQRALTGEGRPVDKVVGDTVYAATLVAHGWLYVRATAVGKATRAGWVVGTLERLPVRDTRATDYASGLVDRQVVPVFAWPTLSVPARKRLLKR